MYIFRLSIPSLHSLIVCFFFNDTATTEIYTTVHTLSLHDALPIYCISFWDNGSRPFAPRVNRNWRSEEHTSELQSRTVISYAVFCLKKKNIKHLGKQQRGERRGLGGSQQQSVH